MTWFRRRSAETPVAEARPRRRLKGWRYLEEVPYVLPKDDAEINRLDFQHYMLRYALRGNFVAPIRAPQSILDVGAGTGRWAIEMARQFPQANVVGVDVTPPPPDAGTGPDIRPENYVFVQGNVLAGLPFPDSSFDFVHVRLLLFAIPAERWPALAHEVLRVTKRGGWVESVETGPQRNGGWAMDALVRWIIEASMRRGVDSLFGPQVAGVFQRAGLMHMQTRELKLPVGRYGGRLGAMAATDVFGVLAGVKQMVVAQGIASEEEYDAALSAARIDLERYRCELPFYIAYGQRG